MLLFVAAALAAPLTECPRPFTSAELMDAAARAVGRFAEQDPEGFDTARADVYERLLCTADPLSPSDIVQVHRVMALGAFFSQDEAKMRAAVSGMLAVDIRARFPEDVIPVGHQLDQLLDQLAGADHPDGPGLKSFSDGWVEVNGSYATNVDADVASTLQYVDNQGVVKETRFFWPGESLGDWEGSGEVPAAPPAKARVRPPQPKLPSATPSGPVTADELIARENRTFRRVILVSSAGAAALATGVLYAVAADAEANALDPEVPENQALVHRDQADALTWTWIGTSVLATGLTAAVVITW